MSTSDEAPMSAVLEALGREIKAERTRRGWSREELAERAGLGSWRQVGKIERGERGQMVEVWRIAEALGVALSEMITNAERVAAS
jgi:transcriptional regulator with XRE-family HTH domain